MNNLNKKIMQKWIKEGGIAVCPEQLGGLPTPRPPSTISNGNGKMVLNGNAKVIDKNGKDVTENFIRGARICLKLALNAGIKKAYLKDGSPSCGFSKTNVKWKKVKGKGVTAALLAANGIKIVKVD